MTPEDMLKELHEIRSERSGFVKYDRDRYLKRREKDLWSFVSRWHMQTFRPEEWKAHQVAETKERARIEAQNKSRKTLSLKNKVA